MTEGLHYDIADDQVLGFNNLVSLIMYTDYTALSSTFSSTFRKKSPFETLKSISSSSSSNLQAEANQPSWPTLLATIKST